MPAMKEKSKKQRSVSASIMNCVASAETLYIKQPSISVKVFRVCDVQKFIKAMEIIKNNKGGEKLCCNGYMYTKKSCQDESHSMGVHAEECKELQRSCYNKSHSTYVYFCIVIKLLQHARYIFLIHLA